MRYWPDSFRRGLSNHVVKVWVDMRNNVAFVPVFNGGKTMIIQLFSLARCIIYVATYHDAV